MDTRQVSRTLEVCHLGPNQPPWVLLNEQLIDATRLMQYAFDDFTISQVAKALGKAADGAKYANRSRGFELVWNPDTTIADDDQIRGFMQVYTLVPRPTTWLTPLPLW